MYFIVIYQVSLGYLRDGLQNVAKALSSSSSNLEIENWGRIIS
jgi:hypothetical protein